MSRHNPTKTIGRLISDHESTRASTASVTPVVHHGRIVDIDDPLNSKRVRARIEGVDDNITDDELPWCISITPNFFYCLPQIEEYVAVLMMNPWNKSYIRFYFGPIQAGNGGDSSYSNIMKNFGFPSPEEENK